MLQGHRYQTNSVPATHSLHKAPRKPGRAQADAAANEEQLRAAAEEAGGESVRPGERLSFTRVQAGVKWNAIVFLFPATKQAEPSQDVLVIHPMRIGSVVPAFDLGFKAVALLAACDVVSPPPAPVMWLFVAMMWRSGDWSAVVEPVFGHQGGDG